MYQIYPALVPGRRRQRRRGSARHQTAVAVPDASWASTPSGSRPSSPRRWPISGTTSPTTPGSIRYSARWQEFDALLAAAHEHGLKVLLDLVPNHTSDQHPWFQESRSSRQSARRDWYIWRDPAPDGGPPNNWLSEFGGSAWQWDERTGQYYYHAFLAAQPDLNWRNPAVRAAIHDVMRFWLRRGVDGFRVDVIWHLLKDDQFRDNPPNPDFQPGQPPHRAVVPLYTTDLPEVHEAIAELRRVLDEFPDRVLLGEIYLPIERLVAYYGRELEGTHLPFNFTLLEAPWRARDIAKLIDDYEAALPPGGWPNWVLGNHDQPRIAGRVGPDQARIAAMLLLTLRGTPTIYYGDEIGMPQVAIPPDRVRDPFERNVPGIGCGRDGARTPMQWDATPHAGFSPVEPWLPVASGFGTRQRRARATRPHVHLQSLSPADRGAPAVAVVAGRPLPADRGDRGSAAVRPRARERAHPDRLESGRRSPHGRFTDQPASRGNRRVERAAIVMARSSRRYHAGRSRGRGDGARARRGSAAPS